MPLNVHYLKSPRMSDIIVMKRVLEFQGVQGVIAITIAGT
uniref:Uncharacterized protein n=1 Tax=Setaria italica TaxID=4555 RepID=K3Y4L8_SETIT